MSDFPDSAVLFKNEYKQSEKHPDYKGRGEWKGSQFDLAAWIKTDRKGQKFMSLKLSKPYEKADAPQDRRQTPVQEKGQYQDASDNLYGGTDEELPF